MNRACSQFRLSDCDSSIRRLPAFTQGTIRRIRIIRSVARTLPIRQLRNYGIEVHIARLHNIFGPEGTWQGGREKAPAAIGRKVAETTAGGTIDICGDRKQTRSFLYVDECVEGVRRLMESDVLRPGEHRI